jgi:hypothetical protein
MSPECMYYENDSHLACLGHRVVGKINWWRQFQGQSVEGCDS